MSGRLRVADDEHRLRARPAGADPALAFGDAQLRRPRRAGRCAASSVLKRSERHRESLRAAVDDDDVVHAPRACSSATRRSVRGGLGRHRRQIDPERDRLSRCAAASASLPSASGSRSASARARSRLGERPPFEADVGERRDLRRPERRDLLRRQQLDLVGLHLLGEAHRLAVAPARRGACTRRTSGSRAGAGRRGFASEVY